MAKYKRRTKSEILKEYGEQGDYSSSDIDLLEVLIDIRDELTKANIKGNE